MNPYRRPHQVRMSVSLPSELAAWVRAEAKRYGVPVSAVIRRAVEEFPASGATVRKAPR